MAKQAKKTPKKSQPNIKKSRLSIKALWVFVISFAVIGGLLLLVSKAATPPAAPSIYLTPDSQNLNVGDTFTVDVYENSGTDNVNVVQADLSYDTSQLSYISHTDASAFPLAAGNPSGDTGSLSFTRGTCGGCGTQTGTQLVLSVTFKALAAGTAPINISSSSYLANNGQTEPGLNTAGGNYTVAAPAGGGGGTGGGGGGTGGGGGNTGGGTTSPPKTSTTTTHHTTTSTTPPASSTPAPTSSPAPTQTSNTATSSIPATTSAEPPLIPASVMRLLKIAGVAAVLATSITIFSWAFGRMRTHMRMAGNHGFGGGVAALPPLSSSQPTITVQPASQNTPSVTMVKTASAPIDSDKPEPGTVLKPGSTKSP